MNYLINILFYMLATFFGIKTIFFGVYEIQQKNIFGGILVIMFALQAYILFMAMMLMQ